MIKKCIVLLLVSCLFLSGCGGRLEENSTSTGETSDMATPAHAENELQSAEETQSAQTAYTGSVLNDYTTEGNHLEGQLSEKLYLDFDYSEEDLNISALPEIPANDLTLSLDAEAVIENLTGKKVDLADYTTDYGNDYKDFAYSFNGEENIEDYAAGCLISDICTNFTFHTEYCSKIFKVFRTLGYENGISTLEEGDLYNNTTRFFEAQDLDFMPKEEAVQEVRSWLEAQGLSLYEKPRVYSIVPEVLRSTEEYLKKAGEISKDRQGNELYVGSWEEADTCYYMEFCTGYCNVPVYEYEELDATSDVSICLGSRIRVLYSEEGIQFLDIEYPYKPSEVQEEAQELISLDEALGLLKERFDRMLLTNEETMTGCYLCYFAYNGSDGIVMTPGWCMELNILVDAEKGLYHPQNLLLNAITGEWIYTRNN